ncbi:MAG TPA: hydrogenase maturation nickel metallochaperone HypA [Gemmatimonadaceae bacterium]|nr:hydrogenase maturation nickel metallochaperone HypA [Gemmatimonadaceae bacterium]
MHELSIAMSLVDLACEQAARMSSVRIRAVHIDVGVLAGVDKDALAFSFQAAAAGTEVDGARIEVREVSATVWCDACNTERALPQPHLRQCSVCGAAAPTLMAGAELQLVSLEVEDVHANR